jgi:hypothetical protein
MALVTADRVRETSTTTGIGNFALSGAVAGRQAFSSVMVNNDTCYYTIDGGAEWEVGLCTWTSGSILIRSASQVYASSAGVGVLVTFSSGTKSVFLVSPAAQIKAAESISNKDFSGGYVGLTGYAINLWNSLKTFKHSLVSIAMGNRVVTFPDKDITVAGTTNETFINPALGTPASGNAANLTGTAVGLNIGGTASNITGIALIPNGGTGQATAQAAINALTQVSTATNEYALVKDTATGNAVWKATAGGVPSVFGRSGAITAQSGDYSAAQVTGAEAIANKDTSGGYAGLTGYAINLWNSVKTFKHSLVSIATVNRTATLPDKDITVAGLIDITGVNSGTNTGDNSANSLYANDYRLANFVAGVAYGRPDSFISINITTAGPNLTGTVYTLDTTQLQNSVFEFTGVLTSNWTVVVAAAAKEFQSENLTTGAFTLTIKTATGTGITWGIAEKTTWGMYCNGVNVEDKNSQKQTTLVAGANITIVGSNIQASGVEVATNKDASGGYVGLTGYAINLWNAAKTFKHSLVSVATANRTITFPDADVILDSRYQFSGADVSASNVVSVSASTSITAGQSGKTFKSVVAAVVAYTLPSAALGLNYVIQYNAFANTVSGTAGSLLLPDGTTTTTFTMPAVLGGEIWLFCDGTNWHIKTFGRTIVANAVNPNEVVALGQGDARYAAIGNAKKPGDIFVYSGTTAPAGAMAVPVAAADVSRAIYAALFAAIGTTWGVGVGGLTFGIPFVPADYAILQANANVGTNTVGAVIAHTHTYNSAALSAGSCAAGANYGALANTGSTGGSANLAAGVRFLLCLQYQ